MFKKKKNDRLCGKNCFNFVVVLYVTFSDIPSVETGTQSRLKKSR